MDRVRFYNRSRPASHVTYNRQRPVSRRTRIPEGVAAGGGLVYVADGEGGLVMLRQEQRVYLPLVLRD